mmetsp:Transcript_36604/g.85169  ORF Transcript_36604/g.85169 Transcript_36604/m.85169 type:complete len:140 (-) Transcript_36604:65-484(-)
MVPPADPCVTVRVSYRGEKFNLVRRTSDNVFSLGAEIKQRTGMATSRQRLICGGRVLVDHNTTLASLLPRAGASELAMMLMPPVDKKHVQSFGWWVLAHRIWTWLGIARAVVVRFFCTLLTPSAPQGVSQAATDRGVGR